MCHHRKRMRENGKLYFLQTVVMFDSIASFPHLTIVALILFRRPISILKGKLM